VFSFSFSTFPSEAYLEPSGRCARCRCARFKSWEFKLQNPIVPWAVPPQAYAALTEKVIWLYDISLSMKPIPEEEKKIR
jgi:hypothetical protein